MPETQTRGELSAQGALSARFPSSLREELEELARRHERSVSGELRYAVNQYVQRSRGSPGEQSQEAE